MKVYGFKKVTLIDFPGRIACTAFTHGCNLRCPFCHNPELVISSPNEKDGMTEEGLLSFLNKREGKLEGIVFTGGEPLLRWSELRPLLVEIRKGDMSVKIDTNGTFPAKLEECIDEGLVDFVAMDFKTSLPQYSRMGADKSQVNAVVQSLRLLLMGDVDYEIRTTLVPGIHTSKIMHDMMPELANAKRYVLQNFVPNGMVDPSFEAKHSFSPEEMQAFLEIALKYNPRAVLRDQQ